MYRVREAWTDERLDDLNAKVDDGFRRMDERFDRMEAMQRETNARFDALQREMNARFQAMQSESTARFETTHRLIIQVAGGMIGTFIVTAAAVISTQL
ncbi:MAG TPA: hypothetical protein VF081_13015 [Solirubrobacterales bacterium]